MSKKKPVCRIKAMVDIFIRFSVPKSAAALSYFLTLSIFPTLVCLYAMLGKLFPDASMLLEFTDKFIPANSFEIITEYIKYISGNNSNALLIGGIIIMLTTSSAGFRTIHNTMADIQGGRRFKGLFFLLFSFLFSVLFLVAIYFAIIVILTGNWFLDFINDALKAIDISGAWTWMRFVLLFAILFIIVWGVYKITSLKSVIKRVFPGALMATLLLVGVSIIFSFFISMTVRYPLVYGSLASIIVMMLWLYICGMVIIMGNVYNYVRQTENNE